MKKEELTALGIDESHRKEFLRIYWADVRKKADQLLQKKEAKNDAPTAADLRAAIGSIVKLIPDPVRLRRILDHTSIEYNRISRERAEKTIQEALDRGYTFNMYELNKQPEQTEPEQDDGGGEDVNTD